MNNLMSNTIDRIKMNYQYSVPEVQEVMNIGMAKVILSYLDVNNSYVSNTMEVKKIINAINDYIVIDTDTIEREVNKFRKYYQSMQTYNITKSHYKNANDIFNHYDYFDQRSLDNINKNIKVFNNISSDSNILIKSLIEDGLVITKVDK